MNYLNIENMPVEFITERGDIYTIYPESEATFALPSVKQTPLPEIQRPFPARQTSCQFEIKHMK